jgi:hypothetical protein
VYHSSGIEWKQEGVLLPLEERVRLGESALTRCAMTYSGGGRFSGEPASRGAARSAGQCDTGRCRARDMASFLDAGLTGDGRYFLGWVPGCQGFKAQPSNVRAQLGVLHVFLGDFGVSLGDSLFLHLGRPKKCPSVPSGLAPSARGRPRVRLDAEFLRVYLLLNLINMILYFQNRPRTR